MKAEVKSTTTKNNFVGTLMQVWKCNKSGPLINAFVDAVDLINNKLLRFCISMALHYECVKISHWLLQKPDLC